MTTPRNPKTASQAPLESAILGALLMIEGRKDRDSETVKVGRDLVMKALASGQLDEAKFRKAVSKLIQELKPMG